MSDNELDQLDYYTLLEVEPDATDVEIKNAFQRFARKYHPDQYPSPSALAERVTRIYRRGTEAYRILMNHDYRLLYDQALEKGVVRLDLGEARMSVQSQENDPESNLAAAYLDPLVKGAERAIEQNNYGQAEENLAAAVKLDPENWDLKARLDYVRDRLKNGQGEDRGTFANGNKRKEPKGLLNADKLKELKERLSVNKLKDIRDRLNKRKNNGGNQ